MQADDRVMSALVLDVIRCPCMVLAPSLDYLYWGSVCTDNSKENVTQ